jgi:hypothetical protein
MLVFIIFRIILNPLIKDLTTALFINRKLENKHRRLLLFFYISRSGRDVSTLEDLSHQKKFNSYVSLTRLFTYY